MTKILNHKFKDSEVIISSLGKVKFDKDGIGEIELEEVYNELLGLPNFHPVVEDAKKDDTEGTEGMKTSSDGVDLSKSMEDAKKGDKETVEPENKKKETPKKATSKK